MKFCSNKVIKIQGKQAHVSVYLLSSLFDAVDLGLYLNLNKARQIFVSTLSNILTLALARLVNVFKRIYQKFYSRRNYKLNRF